MMSVLVYPLFPATKSTYKNVIKSESDWLTNLIRVEKQKILVSIKFIKLIKLIINEVYN